jgi:hypothetical protein
LSNTTYAKKGITDMESKQIYLRFLNLIHALDGGVNAPAMDLDAKKLLEVIAVRHAAEKSLTVTDAMALNTIASPATIHRKLDQLRELGMIDTVFEGKNRRTKYLVPTQMAHDYFDQVGKVMKQALAQA